MAKRKTTSAKQKSQYGTVPQPLEGEVVDRQTQFKRWTQSARAERGSERAFLASKLNMLRTHPGLSDSERQAGEAVLADTFGAKALEKLTSPAKPTPPPPGGVGYGMF